MKKILAYTAIGLIAATISLMAFSSNTAHGQIFGDGNIGTLDQFTGTTSPQTAITQRTFGKALYLSGLNTSGSLRCLQITSAGIVQAANAACGSGGGGSGSGSWATTTSNVPGQLINYSLNNTDIVTIGNSSTTSAPWWYNPNNFIGYLLGRFGIGTTSPSAPLAVNGGAYIGGSLHTTNVTATGTLAVGLTSTFTGQPTFNAQLNVANNVPIRFVGTGGNALQIKAGTGGEGIIQAPANSSMLIGVGLDQESGRFAVTNNALNTDLFTVLGGTGRATFAGPVTISTTTVRGLTVPYASTTVLSAAQLCLTGDLPCRTTWPTSGGGTSAYEVATTSNIAVSQVAYITQTSGRTTLGSVATGTVTCAGSASCSAFTVIGSGTTITGTDSTASSTLLADNNTFRGVNTFGSTTNNARLLTGTLLATSTASSTINGGLDATRVCIIGTSICLNNQTNGTVTSVAASVPAFLSISGSPVTTNGTLAITYSGTALPIANGGTGLTAVGASSTIPVSNGTGLAYRRLTTGELINDAGFTNFTYPFPAGATTTPLTVAIASTTYLSSSYASSTVWRGGGLTTDCDNSVTSKLLWDLTTGQYSCGTDQTGGGSATIATATPTTTGSLSYNFYNTLFNNLYPRKQSAYLGTASSTASTTAGYTFFGGFKDPSRNALWTNAGSGGMTFTNGALTASPNASSDVVAIRTMWTDQFQGYDRITLEVNFNGNTVLTAGDTPVFGFDQGGGRGIVLTNFATNGVNGWQTIDIPISKLTSNYDATPTTAGTGTVINPANDLSNARFRYYESATGYSISIRNIRAYDSTGTLIEDFTNPDLWSMPKPGNALFKVQGIDAMKQTKDTVASQWTNAQIDKFITAIAPLNATHVAVSVPYDNEATYPGGPYATGFAQRWSERIRLGGYNVIWRQTWNAFEGIYGVTKSNAVGAGSATSTLRGTDTTSYLSQIYYYIISHPNQYAPGDIIVPMPEPANAGVNGVTSCSDSVCQFPDAKVFRQWERDAVTVVNAALSKIGLKGRVFVGMYGETGDVAFGSSGGNPQGVLDERTLDSLKVLGIDHYTNPVSDIIADLKKYESVYGHFPLVATEWGTLNETSTTTRGAAIDTYVGALAGKPYVLGLNYWTAISGANENLFYSDMTPAGGFEALRAKFTSGYPANYATHILQKETNLPVAFPTTSPTSGQVLTASSATSTFWGSIAASVGSSFSYLFPNNATTTPLTFASSTNAGTFLSGRFISTSTTATSTFNGGVDVARICITGTTSCLGATPGSASTTLLADNNTFVGRNQIRWASSTALTAANLFIQDWRVATSAEVCTIGEQCQYQTDGTDDQVQIQAAIDAVEAWGGGEVVIKHGLYNIASRILIDRSVNVQLRGEGPGTVLRPTGADEQTIKATSTMNVVIRDMTIDGVNQSQAAFNSNMGVAVKNSQNVLVTGITAKNMYGYAAFVWSDGPTTTKNVIFTNNNFQCNGLQDCIGGGPDSTGLPGFGYSTTSAVTYQNNVVVQKSFAGAVQSSNADLNCIDMVAVQGIDFSDNICYGNIIWGSEQTPNQSSKISGNIIYPPTGPVNIAGDIVVITAGDAHSNLPSNLVISDNILLAGKINLTGAGTNIIQSPTITGNNITPPPNNYQSYNGVQSHGIYLDTVNGANVYGNTINATTTIGGNTGIKATNSTNITAGDNFIKNFATGIDMGSGSGSRVFPNSFIGVTTELANVTNILTMANNGNVGVGTTTPGSIFSIGSVANFVNGTSTMLKGLDLRSGCFSINGTCIGGSGAAGNSFAFPFDPVAGGNATSSLLYLNGGFWTNAASSTCYTSCVINMYGSISNNTGFNSGFVYINDAVQINGNFRLPNAAVIEWNSAAMTLTHSTGLLTFAGGALNFSSSTNNDRFLSGKFLATSTAPSIFPYASSTAVTVSGAFYIPQLAIPSLSTAGQVAVNTTAASSSLRYHDGTATRSLYPTTDRSFSFASSTLAYMGSYGASGTTTILLANPYRPTTLVSFYCKTNTGTAWVGFGNGTATTTQANCSTAGVEINPSANNTWTMRQNFNVEIGRQTGTPSNITITATLRDDAD